MENLERNFNQSGWILCGDTECVCMNFPSPPSFFMKRNVLLKMFQIYHIPLLKLLFCLV